MLDDLRSDLTALARLWPAIRAHRARFVQTVVANMLVQLGTIGVGVGAAWMAGVAMVGTDPAWPGSGELWVLGLIGLLVVIAAAATWAEMYVAHDLAYLVLAALRVRLFDRLRRSHPSRADRRRSGDVSATAMADVESLEWIYAHVFAQVGTALLTLLGGAVALFVIDPILLVVLVPATPLILSVPWWFVRAATRHGAEVREANAAYTADIVDTVQGLDELASAGALTRRRLQLDASFARAERAGIRNAMRGSLEAAAGDVLVSSAALLSLFLVAYQARQGLIPLQLAPVVISLVGAVLAPAAAVASTLKELGGLRAAASRLFSLLDAPETAPPADQPRVPDIETGEVLVLRDVWFGYQANDPVLRGVDLTVRRGETVALVGPSGAGKSTLVDLVRRFWDPDRGSIEVLGVNLRELADADLRRHISVVEQDVRVFAGSLHDNLVLGRPDAATTLVEGAVDAARLRDVATSLPRGLESTIGERGTGLSGGEAVRLAVARSLVVAPDLLVLDEATANLDAGIELELHRALARSAAGRATLIVAHRTSTIERADRVIVLEGGRVVAEGRPDEIRQLPDALSQSSAAEPR